MMYEAEQKNPAIQVHRVGIILNLGMPFHCEIANALRRLCDAQADLHINLVSYGFSMDDDAAQRMTTKALSDRCDIILSIGLVATKNAHKIISRHGVHPFIFIGCGDPVRGAFTTGVIRTPLDHLATIKKFLPIIKNRSRLLIPYTPWAEWGEAEEQVKLITNYVAHHSHLSVKTIPVTSGREALAEVNKQAGKYDALLALESGATSIVTPQLAKMAWLDRAVFCSNGHAAIKQGAACVMAGDLLPYAQATFAIIKDFIMNQCTLGSVPVTVLPNNQAFYVNTDMLARIGMPLHEIEELMHTEQGSEFYREWEYLSKL